MKQHRDNGTRARGADVLLARLDGMIRTVNGQLVESFREELGGQLTLPQYRLLRMIAKARADRVRDVAIFLGATTPAASKAVERLAHLTRQQARILQLICEGRLNKQIAYELSIAETTVKTHVTAIMRKLGVQTRTQAVLIAQMASFSNVLRETE